MGDAKKKIADMEVRTYITQPTVLSHSVAAPRIVSSEHRAVSIIVIVVVVVVVVVVITDIVTLRRP